MEKSVTLNPGESKQVSFTVSKSEPGTYDVVLDGLSGEFLVKENPTGQKRIERIDPEWLQAQPFTSAERVNYTVILKNLYSEPVDSVFGLWYTNAIWEGGWNRFQLEGFEEKRFEFTTLLPGSPGYYPMTLQDYAWGIKSYSGGLSCVITQNPGFLTDGVPNMPYAANIASLDIPSASRSTTRQGMITANLIAPGDSFKLPDQYRTHPFGRVGGTEHRLEQHWAPTDVPYTYEISLFLLPDLMTKSPNQTKWYELCSAVHTLNPGDNSGLFEFNVTVNRMNLPIGSYPLIVQPTIRWNHKGYNMVLASEENLSGDRYWDPPTVWAQIGNLDVEP